MPGVTEQGQAGTEKPGGGGGAHDLMWHPCVTFCVSDWICRDMRHNLMCRVHVRRVNGLLADRGFLSGTLTHAQTRGRRLVTGQDWGTFWTEKPVWTSVTWDKDCVVVVALKGTNTNTPYIPPHKAQMDHRGMILLHIMAVQVALSH